MPQRFRPETPKRQKSQPVDGWWPIPYIRPLPARLGRYSPGRADVISMPALTRYAKRRYKSAETCRNCAETNAADFAGQAKRRCRAGCKPMRRTPRFNAPANSTSEHDNNIPRHNSTPFAAISRCYAGAPNLPFNDGNARRTSRRNRRGRFLPPSGCRRSETELLADLASTKTFQVTLPSKGPVNWFLRSSDAFPGAGYALTYRRDAAKQRRGEASE
ncbi:hypothetical protein TNIN_175771 [Trichonephila inaurata madagascariensis]|uniref:Uncharacterized protein n=1 Tax=Trichonephila inaurata madagascariensis TaxID=2747483 RepID=A0A8X6X6R1_9ARAC|nr:hypothetical protein TNIN_175771 [Trichonephila inaurata madagascariensis]